jgi:hypothetical protein
LRDDITAYARERQADGAGLKQIAYSGEVGQPFRPEAGHPFRLPEPASTSVTPSARIPAARDVDLRTRRGRAAA